MYRVACVKGREESLEHIALSLSYNTPRRTKHKRSGEAHRRCHGEGRAIATLFQGFSSFYGRWAAFLCPPRPRIISSENTKKESFPFHVFRLVLVLTGNAVRKRRLSQKGSIAPTKTGTGSLRHQNWWPRAKIHGGCESLPFKEPSDMFCSPFGLSAVVKQLHSREGWLVR